MTKDHQTLRICDLFAGNYQIPPYQRNFAWTYKEIEQLIQDIEDSCKDAKDRYYIGTLVVDTKNNIIDGQQRSTALTLIALALQNDYGETLLNHIPINFPARKGSNETLQKLYKGELPEEDDEIKRGYHDAKEGLKNVENIERFTHCLLYQVFIFQSILPEHLDLNLYFERFNSRGEQLEAHEIIKAQMMAKLEEADAQRFAEIWDACSEFEVPVIRGLKLSNTKQKEVTLNKNEADASLVQVSVESDSKLSILDALKEDQNSDVVGQEDRVDAGNYTSIINFETLLLYCIGIDKGDDASSVQLDDKKLLQVFDLKDKSSSWVMDFLAELLCLRELFDTYIIKNDRDISSSGETHWVLKKIKIGDKNQSLVNTFEDSLNKKIIMLQSMFAVTYTANRDSRWLYEAMQFLYHHVYSYFDNEELGQLFLDKLEGLAIAYAKERLFSDDACQIKSYHEEVPVYAFNFVDYVLWDNREELKDQFFDADHFRFTYRRSIEHWYPQNPDAESKQERLDDETLHAFSNLAITTGSQNSKFSNLIPAAKYNQWEEIFNRQSLKLQWMAKITDSNGWDKEQIDRMTIEIEELVSDFINTHQKGW